MSYLRKGRREKLITCTMRHRKTPCERKPQLLCPFYRTTPEYKRCGSAQAWTWQELHSVGLRKGVPKQISFNQVQRPKQCSDKGPAKFLECIFEACHQITNAGPEAPENLKVVSMTVLGQSAPDVQRKLRKLKRPFECLCHCWWRWLFSCSITETRSGEKSEMKQQADLLAAALTTRGPKKTMNKIKAVGNKGPAPKVGPKQCAYCKPEGHWGWGGGWNGGNDQV